MFVIFVATWVSVYTIIVNIYAVITMNATIVVVKRSVLNCFIATQCAVSQQININIGLKYESNVCHRQDKSSNYNSNRLNFIRMFRNKSWLAESDTLQCVKTPLWQILTLEIINYCQYFAQLTNRRYRRHGRRFAACFWKMSIQTQLWTGRCLHGCSVTFCQVVNFCRWFKVSNKITVVMSLS